MTIIVNRVDVGYVQEAPTLEVLKYKRDKDGLLSRVIADDHSGRVCVVTKGSDMRKYSRSFHFRYFSRFCRHFMSRVITGTCVIYFSHQV